MKSLAEMLKIHFVVIRVKNDDFSLLDETWGDGDK
jgi:hypothetical protein